MAGTLKSHDLCGRNRHKSHDINDRNREIVFVPYGTIDDNERREGGGDSGYAGLLFFCLSKYDAEPGSTTVHGL